MPEVFTVCRTRQASNQPQRRLRPVTVPNSWPRTPRRSPACAFQIAIGPPGSVDWPEAVVVPHGPLSRSTRPSPPWALLKPANTAATRKLPLAGAFSCT